MAKCRNEKLISSLNYGKITDETKVTIEVLSDLDNCKTINTKNFVDTTAGSTYYDAFQRPMNMFECNPRGCKTTGTLFLRTESDNASATYRFGQDAREFVTGVVTLYVMSDSSADIDVSIQISSVGDMTNYDIYTVPVAGADGKFVPVAVDLSKAPTSTGGGGWSADENGADFVITVPSGTGISSIAIFDEVDEFITSSVVELSCASSLGSDIELAVQEATCVSSGYDTSSKPTIDVPVTFRKFSPNFWKLNPMLRKGDTVNGYRVRTVEKTLSAPAGSGYAVAQLPDAFEEECGFYNATLSDSCDFVEAQLDRLIMPVGFEVTPKQFIVGPNATGGQTVYFDRSLEGQKVLITYPQFVEVEERVADFSNITSVRTRLNYEYKYNDGTEVIRSIDNCLVTTIPGTLTNADDNELNISFRIQPDDNGIWWRERRVVK